MNRSSVDPSAHTRQYPGTWRLSLRWRLLGATGVALVVALSAAGWVLSNLFHDHVQQQFELDLQRQLNLLTAQVDVNGVESPQTPSTLVDPRWHTPYSGLYWQVESVGEATGQAKVVQRSRSLWDQVLNVPQDRLEVGVIHRHRITLSGTTDQTLEVMERTVRVEGEPGKAPRWRVMVAADTQPLDQAAARFTRELASYLLILALSLMGVAWAQVMLGLAPLQRLQEAVQALRLGRSARLDGLFPKEVEPLVDDFNRVLDHNHQVVERSRQLAGNLAHAIKTPLAVMRNLAGGLPASSQDAARQFQEQIQHMQAQVEWQLGRARVAGAGVPGLRTPVAPVIEGLARVMRKVHADREGKGPLTIQLPPMPPEQSFGGEKQDLQEILGNILDNACKWARAQVRVSAHAQAGQLLIDVEDDGPGLDEEQRRVVFERGVRIDERTPGSGLGLDIVRELVQLYRGQVQLDESPLGGLRVTLSLPS